MARLSPPGGETRCGVLAQLSVEGCVPGPRLVQRQAFPLAEAQLLEGRVRLDLEAVGRRDRGGRVERAPKRARVDGGEGVLLELAGGRFGLDEAFRR